MAMAGLKPCGVLCEIMNPDGTMARFPELKMFSEKYGIPMVTVQDIIEYRKIIGMNCNGENNV
jgi:3,4-dihydroxy 2-butanone 4-phosphate synthase